MMSIVNTPTIDDSIDVVGRARRLCDEVLRPHRGGSARSKLTRSFQKTLQARDDASRGVIDSSCAGVNRGIVELSKDNVEKLADIQIDERIEEEVGGGYDMWNWGEERWRGTRVF